jgi:hypothetical protein
MPPFLALVKVRPVADTAPLQGGDGRVPAHVDEFRPSEVELVAQV